ncbi:MAG: exodeoxyribonuclease VII small subunit [Bacteroidales bacterium]|nr:exodeoxyribonuclease VII small subunit [Bacteroidales bacterium]
MKKFDYLEALSRLDLLAARIEDPATGLPEIEKYLKESAELIEACRKYLRGLREGWEKTDAA